MAISENKYHLQIGPSIFLDGTFGIYAVPEHNPAMEYQLAGQFKNGEEASEMAREFLKYGGDTFTTTDVKVIDTREVNIDTVVSQRTPEKQEATLKEQLKELFKAPKTARFRPFARITEATPHLLSYFALVIFAFSISFSMPTWVPVLGDWIGKKSFDPDEFAKYLPYLIVVTTIFVQIRARAIGLKLSAMRDYVLSLTLKHGWQREQFSELFLEVIETSGYSWARKLGEWISKWDPNTLSQVRASIEGKLQESPATQEFKKSYSELQQYTLAEDFEARIHSLYYMDKEHNFRDWAVVLYPVFFLVNYRRAIRRLRVLSADGLAGFVYLGLCSLPGGDDYRVHRRTFPYIAMYELLVIGTPLVWAFAREPWKGILGLLGMGVVVLIAIVPMMVWNYQLLVRHRGLPRGMSWEEIQADYRFIRAM